MEIPLATTLDLLCVAATPSSRTGGFAAPDEGLDEGGRRHAEKYRLEPRFRAEVLRGSARAAAETAQALGVTATIAPALDDADHGAWLGRSFAEIHAESPERLAAWLADPLAGAPGGETMAAVQARVGAWLDGIAPGDRPVCAITHPMVVRAALAHALALPLRATLAIDIVPLARVRLSFNGMWRLQGLVPGE
ncbi:histidine phosphatase family protein [Novosphingobium sp. JCM 18896]|uniref:histidine phosphatase family protein n=1 Tax=Novosphingobium sp. JCM 18896 TaxID=2989731 RepID=UPI002221BB2C|nr:histidine phosphatase family protein [Novosphingobium sp. JCM 18896]MCW1429928.1 histidine phosphatase family protein [Novosphingobium sp. JCM 18896]